MWSASPNRNIMVQIPMEAIYRQMKNEKVRGNILYRIYKVVIVLCEQNVNTVDFFFSDYTFNAYQQNTRATKDFG